jgi:hypothetical protein
MLTPLTLGLISAVLIAIGLGLVLRDMWRARSSEPIRAVRGEPDVMLRGDADVAIAAERSVTVRTKPSSAPASPHRGADATGRPAINQTAATQPVTARPATARSKNNVSVDDIGDSAVTIVHRTAPPPARSLRTSAETTQRPSIITPGESPAFDLLQSTIASIGSLDR